MIGLELARPAWLLLLLLAPLGYLAWRRWPPPLPRGRSRLVLGSRILLLALVVLALTGVRATTEPARRAVVAVVDLSASAKSRGGIEAEAAMVRSLQAGRGPDDLFGVVTFGHDALVEMAPTARPDFTTFQTQPDPSYTNIAGALRLAAGLMPDGYARQLVLLSDGRQNLDDAPAAVAELRSQGVRVDVVPVGGAPPAEALVAAVEAPALIRLGQNAGVTVRLQSTEPASGRLLVTVDGTQTISRDILLPAGSSAQSFDYAGLAEGLHRVRAELVVAPDTYSENNVGEAAVKVVGRPLVLVLEGKEGEGLNVARALEATGMAVDRRPALAAPTDTATLGRYDATVVVDAPADSFPKDSLAALEASVHDLGKGLVAVGGPTAYGPGGWQGTPLENALPVLMDIPNRKDKPKVAVVLNMESMEDPRADRVAVSAAEAVIDKLTPQDQVAVTDGRSGFIVPMTPAADKRAIDARLEAATLGDADSYLQFIQMAGDALLRTDASVRHIVVLGDGDPDAEAGRQAAVQSAVQGLAARGVTTSAIAVDVHGQPQYMAYMQDIARWGGGRYYVSNNPSQVPQLFLKESVTALRPWYEQQPFFPKIGAPGELLQSVDTAAFPQLEGYVVTTPKPSSEEYLVSDKQDPVLAAWSFGLGRAAAWTSDSTGLWTGGFLKSPTSARLFARMVGWVLPAGAGGLTVLAEPSGDGLQITVSGPPVSGRTLRLGVVRPDLSSAGSDLVATGPGRWQGRIDVATVGLYLLHATMLGGGAAEAQTDAAVAVPYSPEYLQLGRDQSLLRQVAAAGSGRLLAAPVLAWAQPSLPVPVSSDLFWLLLLLAVVLWPLDVAARRIAIRPRRLLANLAEYRRDRRMTDLEVGVPDELARLRRRVESVRRREPSPGPAQAGDVAEGGSGGAAPGPAMSGASPPAPPEDPLSARLLDARRRRRGRDG